MSADLYTNVTIEDRNFSIMKFDARTGLKMARLLLSKIAPLLPYIKTDNEGDKADAEAGEDANPLAELEAFRNLVDIRRRFVGRIPEHDAGHAEHEQFIPGGGFCIRTACGIPGHRICGTEISVQTGSGLQKYMESEGPDADCDGRQRTANEQ